MGNEIIWYILIGAIYLLYEIRRKRSKQSAKRPQPFEEALRTLTTSPHAETPATYPLPTSAQPVEVKPQPWDEGSVTHKPARFDGQFQTASSSPPPPLMPPTASTPRAKEPRNMQASTIVARLQDPKSAQDAVMLSEVLGRPHALRKR